MARVSKASPAIAAMRQRSLTEKLQELSEDPPHDPETGEIVNAAPEPLSYPDQEEALRRAAEAREILEATAREKALNGRREFDEWYAGRTPEEQQGLAPHMKNLMAAANKVGKK